MSVPTRRVIHQGPVLAALLRAAYTAASSSRPESMETPGPVLTQTVPARSRALVDDYIRHVGGDRKAYRGIVPAHFFPQWGFPLLSRTLDDIPYDLTKVLNGGCRIEFNAPLPDNEPLHLQACLMDIDDNGRRAVLKQQLITGTRSAPEAIVSTLYAIVPHKRDPNAPKKPKKTPAIVPVDAKEVARWKIGPTAGRDFAILTGDFNPIHWIGPAAKMAGFKNVILHGFSTLARAIETLNQQVYSGDVHRLRTVDVQFTKPLVLPAKVGLFVDTEGGFYVGKNPGGNAFLTGTTTLVED